MTKSRWCRSSSRRPSTCHILSIAFGHGFAHECVARHPIPTRVRSWSRSWGGALLAISSPAWLRCPVPDEGALLCTPSPARPRPHAHAGTPTPMTNRLPLYCRTVPVCHTVWSASQFGLWLCYLYYFIDTVWFILSMAIYLGSL